MGLAVATWNVNSLRVRKDHLVRWTQEHPEVDVLCLQETKVEDDKFPHKALEEAGWTHRIIWGQRTYNGVALLSRHPIEDPAIGFTTGEKDDQARLVRGTVKGVRVIGCYVPNGQEVGSPKFRYKLAWLRHLRADLTAEGRAADLNLLLCGDFNIAPHEQDTYDPWEVQNGLLFHPLEHKTLAKVQRWGLTDALRHLEPESQRFTWWDYRFNGFRRNIGFRIDHIYLTPPLVERLESVETHRDVRGWEQPSDHVPVVAHFSDA